MTKTLISSLFAFAGAVGLVTVTEEKPTTHTLEMPEMVIIGAVEVEERAKMHTHWSCPEAFGEQTRGGIVTGCQNGSAVIEHLDLVDEH